MKPAAGAFCENCGGQIQWQNPASQLPVGSLLRGSTGRVYQVGAAKGQGGFGITYAAMDLGSWDRVAVKEYYPSRSATRESMNTVICTAGQTESFQKGMASFLEEGRTLSTVGALPSVVSVRDSFEANGTAYIVMEYVDGLPLHEVVKRRGQIPWQELKPMLQPLMRDLDILHRAGVIHRDISPDNLILTPDNTLKLLDFGSARNLHAGDMTVMLKAGFSPVEQYQSKGQGPYTDVYALAGTIYYCLTGIIPPTSIERLTSDELKGPNAYNAGLTAGEANALLWGMKVQPTARPKTMKEFSDALLGAADASADTAQTGEKKPQTVTQTQEKPVSAQAVGSTGNQGKGSRGGSGKKLGLILGAAAAAVLAVVLGLVLILGGTKTAGDFKYKVSGGEARVVGYFGTSRDVLVPSQLDGHRVTSIGKNAFADNDKMYSVTLPEGVSSVGKNAFRNCTSLRLVSVQGSDTGSVKVDDTAFSGCDSLRCIVAGGQSRPIQWKGSSDVAVCYVGTELDQGTIRSVMIDSGVAYAMTSWDCAVALTETATGKLPAYLDGCRVFDVDGKRVSVESGVTDDGLEYEINNGEAYIVGYRGEASFFSMPDVIDDYPITMICGGALAGNTTVETVLMPIKLVTIQAEAFRGCSSLIEVDIYSHAETVDPTAFQDCDSLRCIVSYEDIAAQLSSAALNENCRVLTFNMDTGDGGLSYVDVSSDGAIYAITENETAVLMDVPAGVSRLEVPDEIYYNPVVWAHPSALDRVSSDTVILMSPDMGFPLELYNKADWSYDDVEDFCAGWLISCEICTRINAIRTNAPQILPDRATVAATQIRAPELARSFSGTRPNGDNGAGLLDQCGVEWDSGTHQRDRYEITTEDQFAADMEALVENLVESFEGTYDDGRYYTKLGTSIYISTANKMFYVSTFAIVVGS